MIILRDKYFSIVEEERLYGTGKKKNRGGRRKAVVKSELGGNYNELRQAYRISHPEIAKQMKEQAESVNRMARNPYLYGNVDHTQSSINKMFEPSSGSTTTTAQPKVVEPKPNVIGEAAKQNVGSGRVTYDPKTPFKKLTPEQQKQFRFDRKHNLNPDGSNMTKEQISEIKKQNKQGGKPNGGKPEVKDTRMSPTPENTELGKGSTGSKAGTTGTTKTTTGKGTGTGVVTKNTPKAKAGYIDRGINYVQRTWRKSGKLGKAGMIAAPIAAGVVAGGMIGSRNRK